MRRKSTVKMMICPATLVEAIRASLPLPGQRQVTTMVVA
jgi:hypothetical protein